MENNGAFEYGGYHFIPERQFTAAENNFASISRRQNLDIDLGFCRENYAYPSKYPYSHESFYAASPDKTCDLFRCVENGKLYIPCENDLQEYMEFDLHKNLEVFKREARPFLERLLIERFPSTFREMPDSFINAVLEDVYTDSAWQAEGRFNSDDVSLALQSELMICVHEIHGREQPAPVRQSDAKKPEKKCDDVQVFDALDIRKMSPLEVLNDITIGDRAVVIGKIHGGEFDGNYMTSYRHHENAWFKYTNVKISRDYLKIMDAYSQHISAQTDKTNIQISAPFFEGVDLEPIYAEGCKLLSEGDDLIGKVVVIKADVLRPEYQHSTYQLRLCVGGFGAHPRSRGSACFCKSLLTGEEGRFERDEILGTIERDSLPMWAKQKLAEIEKNRKKDRGVER